MILKQLTVKPPDPTLALMEAINITQQVPVRADPEGVIRVGGTRVTLDTLVAAFGSGATPEEIAQQYPS